MRVEVYSEVAPKTRTDILFIFSCLIGGKQGGFQIRLGEVTAGIKSSNEGFSLPS